MLRPHGGARVVGSVVVVGGVWWVVGVAMGGGGGPHRLAECRVGASEKSRSVAEPSTQEQRGPSEAVSLIVTVASDERSQYLAGSLRSRWTYQAVRGSAYGVEFGDSKSLAACCERDPLIPAEPRAGRVACALGKPKLLAVCMKLTAQVQVTDCQVGAPLEGLDIRGRLGETGGRHRAIEIEHKQLQVEADTG